MRSRKRLKPMQILNPPELGRPRGFAHGVLTEADARMLFVAGQTAVDEAGRVSAPDFAAQFDVALDKVLCVVRAAGGEPRHVARMTIYVTDIAVYRESRPKLADIWRRAMGSHYPAMALVAVNALLDQDALVEIQADAVLP